MLLAHTREGDRYVFDQPLRLLAVDDDPIMREFAVAKLSQPGCEIVTAEDGEAAWDILEGDARGFDLVLTDLEMPRLNGFGLLGQIRAGSRFAHLPVVVITTRDDVFAIDRAYELGATSFVSKPVNWRLLGHQLRYVMRTSRMEAEIRAARDEGRRRSAPEPPGAPPARDPDAAARHHRLRRALEERGGRPRDARLPFRPRARRRPRAQRQAPPRILLRPALDRRRHARARACRRSSMSPIRRCAPCAVRPPPRT